MSKVYFISIENRKYFSEKIKYTFNKFNLNFEKNNLIAVKCHFGEKGNTAYIKPFYINYICSLIESKGGIPFLTDTNTLYKGERSNSVKHIKNAQFNGFCKYPIIIADGLRGESYVKKSINGELLKKAYIAHDLYYCDAMVVITHFKGHELSGFGGAIKNIGMGGAARMGKLEMHSNINPFINEKCIGCMICANWCDVNAIKKRKQKAYIDNTICTGCGLCIEICPKGAIKIKWDMESKTMQMKMSEYALAVHKKYNLYFNFLMDITPVCDCYSYSDKNIIRDIGILISNDPVSIDNASYEIVNKTAGYNIFKKVHPNIDPLIQLEHAQKIGLGERKYELIEV